MNLLTSLLALFNIGFFGNLVARLTGANVSILLFCGLLFMGATPVQVAGIMATYLVFIKLVGFRETDCPLRTSRSSAAGFSGRL